MRGSCLMAACDTGRSYDEGTDFLQETLRHNGAQMESTTPETSVKADMGLKERKIYICVRCAMATCEIILKWYCSALNFPN